MPHPKIICHPASFRNEAQQRNDPTETPRKWHQSALRKLSRLAVCRRIKCANIGNQTLRCPGRLLLLLLLLCNRALRNCFDLIHELRALLIYSGVVDIDASIPGLRSVNKRDAKCKCAMRNVIFVSELIGFGDRKASPPPTELNLKRKTAQQHTLTQQNNNLCGCTSS